MLPVVRSRALVRIPRQIQQRRLASTSESSNEVPRPQWDNPNNGANNTYVPPAEEGMGKGYFAIIASVIGATVAYKTYTGAWTPGKDPISVYVKEKQEALVKEWQEEQTKHALFMEQAAKDRVFLMNAPLNHTPVLRYQEGFNAGSPWNREAGWRSDLTELKRFLANQEKSKW